MDLTAIFLGFFGFLKLLTIMAFALAIFFISKMGRRKRRWENHGLESGSDHQPRSEDDAILDSIARVAEKMEKRLEALENILEADDPKWKERAR